MCIVIAVSSRVYYVRQWLTPTCDNADAKDAVISRLSKCH